MADGETDLAGLIARIKDQHGVNETQIARRIGTGVSTVNSWVHRKRGTGRGPNPGTLRKLAAEFAIPERDVFAAANCKPPRPVSPDTEQRLLALFKELTAEQQETTEIQLSALVEHNRRNRTIR